MSRHQQSMRSMTKTDVSGDFGEGSGYIGIHGDIVALLEAARHTAARSVNALMTASYWEIGRRIVEFEQGGRIGQPMVML